MSDEMRELYVWLDDRLQQIATAQSDAHGRLRADMSAGFTDLRARFHDVFEQARTLSDRTLVIEVERKMERRAWVKVGVIYGAIAGAVTSGVVSAAIRVIME